MVQTFEPEGSGAVDSNITDGAEFNEEAPVTRTDTTDFGFKSAGGDTDVVKVTWVSLGLDNADWPSGDYKGGTECQAIGAQQSYKIQLTRYNAAGTLQETLGTSGSFNTTGPHAFTANVNPASGVSTDRFCMRLLGTRPANHGNQQYTTTIADVDTFMEVPFDAPAGGFAHSQGQVIG